MKYKIIVMGRPICREDIIETMPFIPNTAQTIFFDTEADPYKQIWYGYLGMRESQKKHKTDPLDWVTIKIKETAPEIDKVKECINQFCRFLGGEGRDNCNAVYEITEIN